MGLHEPSNRMYLKVTLGKLRKKVDANTPKAVARTTEEGDIVHELIYNGITGILENIVMKEHPEYGKSWTIQLKEGDSNYGVQVSENSRYGTDLLRKLPNLKKGAVYTFTPYDFEVDGNKKTGLSIKTESGEKIESFYQKFTKDGDKTIIENINGFPEFTGDKKDNDDWKIYFTQVTKFLRGKAINYLANEFLMEAESHSSEPPKEDDLPF